MKISLIISLFIIILSITINIILFENKKEIKSKLLIFFVVGIISIAILIYPLLEYSNTYLKALASFMYSLKCIGMVQDLNILTKIDLNTTMGYIYFIYINILFLVVPSLTVGVIITYLEKIKIYLKFKLSKNKKIYVFSEINEKSLIISQKLEEKKNSIIIFANIKEKNNTNNKSIKLNEKITNIKFNNSSEIIFYMISQNEDENLNETLELIDKYKNREKTKIYIINKKEETSTILDSTNKGKVIVDIINEDEKAVFSLLNNKPLFLNTINKTISILIVGCGNIGKEFLKDSVWCSMMPGYKLKILVIDKDANRIKENIEVETPELLKHYNITFLNEEIKTKNATQIIKERKDINYILVAMDNDNKNIETAILLRRLFLRELNREPIINLYIENEYKQKQILELSNEKGNSYNLNTFGSINNLYQTNNIMDSELEKIAIQIHLSYDPEDKNLQRYNLREYNKRSSRASALHIKYKLYSILEDKYTNNMRNNLKLFREIYSKKIEEILSRNEHDRWNAYMRSIGYVYVSTEEVAKYYEKNKHYINYLAKMHPALVDYDELDKISKELSKITSKKIDLKESDIDIIQNIYKKIDLK